MGHNYFYMDSFSYIFQILSSIFTFHRRSERASSHSDFTTKAHAAGRFSNHILHLLFTLANILSRIASVYKILYVQRESHINKGMQGSIYKCTKYGSTQLQDFRIGNWCLCQKKFKHLRQNSKYISSFTFYILYVNFPAPLLSLHLFFMQFSALFPSHFSVPSQANVTSCQHFGPNYTKWWIHWYFHTDRLAIRLCCCCLESTAVQSF